jgi:hypothetical protein
MRDAGVSQSLTTSADDEIGAFIPINRRMTGPRALRIVNTDETAHDCIAEAFTQKYHVFILIHSVKAVSPWVSVLSSV